MTTKQKKRRPKRQRHTQSPRRQRQASVHDPVTVHSFAELLSPAYAAMAEAEFRLDAEADSWWEEVAALRPPDASLEVEYARDLDDDMPFADALAILNAIAEGRTHGQ